MRKKKGFTLVEVLAVIAIIAIIALIAVPVINGIILKARKGAFTRSAENMLKAGNTYYIESELEGPKGEIRFECKDNQCISETKDANEKNINLNVEGDMGEGYIRITKEGDVEFQLQKLDWCATKYLNKEQIYIR